MNLYPHILGCLLGTAVGDAVGLRREGMSRQRAARLYGGAPLAPGLLFGRGFCSDDTEHAVMVGRALALSAGDPDRLQRLLAADLRKWLLTAPAGVGFATLRACAKLLVGFGPARSGVKSAGNGPAMLSALIGVCARDDRRLAELVRASTRLTHTDPRAEEGALLVAQAARLSVASAKHDPIEFLQAAASRVSGSELRNALGAAAQALIAGQSPLEFAQLQGWTQGVSGYVNQTVPAALYCWAYTPSDFRQSVENAVLLGGDTDSVAAITGAISGAHLGCDAIPRHWIAGLAEWPRTTEWMTRLATALASAVGNETAVEPPSMRWLATVPRNLAFGTIVIVLALRRLLPPY